MAETGFGGDAFTRVDMGRRYEIEPAYAAPVETATAAAHRRALELARELTEEEA